MDKNFPWYVTHTIKMKIRNSRSGGATHDLLEKDLDVTAKLDRYIF